MKVTSLTSALITQALKVAVVVGSILLLINQYDAIFGNQPFRWLPAILTYGVPFGVFLLGQRAGKANKVLID